MVIDGKSKTLTGSHIPALDGLRGIAAFMVFCAHAGVLPWKYGAFGVSVFFVLSGFLITWLLLRENDRTGDVSLKAFYMRRTLRIFPAFYVFWIFCVVVTELRGVKIPWPEAFSSLAYFGDYYGALRKVLYPHQVAIMGITWSLGVEEKFYLLWPWLFVKYRDNRPLLIKIAMAGISCVWIYRIVVWSFLSPPDDYLRYAFESRWDNLMYGCLLALLIKENRISLKTRWWTPVPLMMGLVFSVYLEGRIGSSYQYLFGMSFDAALMA